MTRLNLAANDSLQPVAQPCLLYLTLHHIPTFKLENGAQGICNHQGAKTAVHCLCCSYRMPYRLRHFACLRATCSAKLAQSFEESHTVA